MPVSITWGTKVIFVPKADLTPLGGNLYELDVNAFRLELKDLEDSPEGMSHPDTHRHNTEVTLAGVTYARSVEIINGYTVEFEDDGTPAGHYVVSCVGANHNLADVKVPNGTSLIIGNSAGLIVRESGTSGLTAEESVKLDDLHARHMHKYILDHRTGEEYVYEEDGSTVRETFDVYEDPELTIKYRGSGLSGRVPKP